MTTLPRSPLPCPRRARRVRALAISAGMLLGALLTTVGPQLAQAQPLRQAPRLIDELMHPQGQQVPDHACRG